MIAPAPSLSPQPVTVDGNEAAASVAYRLSEMIAIYPITPSTSMGEWCDEWSAQGRPNLWGAVPHLHEMQSEAGVAGALHGMLQAGSLATSFTASQGLLLMIPELYKIAGELTPFVLHVAARSLATHALSIFGDHSDVMACRQTGCAFLVATNVQEAQDMAAIAHAATLQTRVPFIHFFDGFRTSHEVGKIIPLPDDDLRSLIDEAGIAAHAGRALTPERPSVRGTAQNPDVFFQAREASNPFYESVPPVVAALLEQFGERTGRRYQLCEYHGSPTADRVIIVMGSGAETCTDTAAWLNAHGERVGVLNIRLYRPFPIEALLEALPANVRKIAVLDRCKEPGAPGEPLFLDVMAALHSATARRLRHGPPPIVVGGRYGLASKEFTPAMARAVFGELREDEPQHNFTVGIRDDVTRRSLPYDADFDIEDAGTVKAVFFGLGSDGTVGANKNSIKIIGEETNNFAQGYFVYDSKKSGAVTISHLRFGPHAIRAPYLIRKASFVACHQWSLLEQLDVFGYAAPGARILLNSPFKADRLWDHLPREIQQAVLAKGLRLHTIDAYQVARDLGLGGRINTIMQTCFFALSGVLPREEAIEAIKHAIEKSYARKGPEVVLKNFAAVDATLAALFTVKVPIQISSGHVLPPIVPPDAPDFVQRVIGTMLAGKGDDLPVSAFPVDGVWPVATSRWEKRNLALEVPVWDTSLCIQCNKCVVVCPHAAIRAKYYPDAALEGAPASFHSAPLKTRELPGHRYTLQVAVEDCTGCNLCIEACPAKDKTNPSHKAINMAPQPALRDQEHANFEFFLQIPDPAPETVKAEIKSAMFQPPLLEFSGACAGCGETPYIKLLTQLSGDHLVIANATGCSSIYGGNLPTTPYTTNAQGRGPAWANSLFEDNAEFGYGIRAALDQRAEEARQLLAALAPQLGDETVRPLLDADLTTPLGRAEQRRRVEALLPRLRDLTDPIAERLIGRAEHLLRRDVWIVGGDGWAYDIGYGGLDHVISQGLDVNILVLDTEVYSNTGGQASKSTPIAAVAKFATAGKARGKKDMAVLAATYGNVYVARIALGAKDSHTIKVFEEATSFPGPSLILAYSPCIAHGYPLQGGLDHQKLAVASGHWPLLRHDPRRTATAGTPWVLDCAPPSVPLSQYLEFESRFRTLVATDPERAAMLATAAQAEVDARWARYARLAQPAG